MKTVTEVMGAKSAGFTQESSWRFAADGAVTVETTVTPYGTLPMALPRMGFSLKLDKSLERMKYYGRGPRENYVDRLTGSFLGVWESTVAEQYEPYVRPQDNGYKCDVRWVELTDKDGKGVRFGASEPLFVQALHYGMEDLEFARHRPGEKRFRAPLVPREEVCLNLDVRQLGLGGASCGPVPMDKYRFNPNEPTSWSNLGTGFAPMDASMEKLVAANEKDRANARFRPADRPHALWAEEPELWAYGLWQFEWDDSFVRVKGVNADARTVTIDASGLPFLPTSALAKP